MAKKNTINKFMSTNDKNVQQVIKQLKNETPNQKTASKEMKTFATKIKIDLHKRFKSLAVQQETSITNLLNEAIEDLLKKYSE